jgi:hypothetical protein
MGLRLPNLRQTQNCCAPREPSSGGLGDETLSHFRLVSELDTIIPSSHLAFIVNAKG